MRKLFHAVTLVATTLFTGCSSSGPGDAVDRTVTGASVRSECDRTCLDEFAKRYLDALVANDPTALPMASDIRFTEDGLDLLPGEGFWATATGLRQHRLNILDDEWDTAAGLAVMEEGDQPVLLAYRMKIRDRKVAELETLVVRQDGERQLMNRGELAKPPTAFLVEVPPGQRESREELIRISQYYPDGLRVGSFVEVDAPFAQGARRLENGLVLAGPDCTFNANCKDIKTQPSPTRPTLRQRLLAVDEEQGITFYWLAWEQQSGKTLIVWEAFKVYDGKIHAVEAFLKHGDPVIDAGWPLDPQPSPAGAAAKS